jgi:hypothetical protein
MYYKTMVSWLTFGSWWNLKIICNSSLGAPIGFLNHVIPLNIWHIQIKNILVQHSSTQLSLTFPSMSYFLGKLRYPTSPNSPNSPTWHCPSIPDTPFLCQLPWIPPRFPRLTSSHSTYLDFIHETHTSSSFLCEKKSDPFKL